MQLSILSPTKAQTVDINWLEVQTSQGSFVIKDGHAPMVVLVSPNQELHLELKDGSTTIMTITGGILEITRHTATLLLTHE